MRVVLCGGGYCPYIEEKGDKIVIYDDTSTITVRKDAGGIKIELPKEWLDVFLVEKAKSKFYE